MKIPIAIFFLAVLVSNVACMGQPFEDATAPTVTQQQDEPAVVATSTPNVIPSPATESAREERLTPDPIDLPEPIPTQIPETPVTSEAPAELVEEMIADLAQRLDVAVEQIAVLRAEEVIWPDGALGCPQPGQVYTQAQVRGYHVTLGAGDDAYDYHANQRGYFIFCEQTVTGTRPPAGTPAE